jgi:hypothetical protein
MEARLDKPRTGWARRLFVASVTVAILVLLVTPLQAAKVGMERKGGATEAPHRSGRYLGSHRDSER